MPFNSAKNSLAIPLTCSLKLVSHHGALSSSEAIQPPVSLLIALISFTDKSLYRVFEISSQKCCVSDLFRQKRPQIFSKLGLFGRFSRPASAREFHFHSDDELNDVSSTLPPNSTPMCPLQHEGSSHAPIVSSPGVAPFGGFSQID